MACQSCAERRAAMKVWIAKKADNARRWAAVRAGQPHTQVGGQERMDGIQPAGDPRATHGEQAMASDPEAGVGQGATVPGVYARRPGDASDGR